jgi:hypothetical protein
MHHITIQNRGACGFVGLSIMNGAQMQVQRPVRRTIGVELSICGLEDFGILEDGLLGELRVRWR